LLRYGPRIFVVGSHFEDDLGVPEAGLDGEVCDLSGERGDAEEEECGAEDEGADGGPRVHGELLKWSGNRAREEFSTVVHGRSRECSCVRTNAHRCGKRMSGHSKRIASVRLAYLEVFSPVAGDEAKEQGEQDSTDDGDDDGVDKAA